MAEFEVTGDLLTDLQNAIEYQTVMYISYVDRKGNASVRNIGPLEIRGDKMYAADLDKMALRLFVLANIQEFEVIDQTFDKDALELG